MSGKMTASYQPIEAFSRRLESLASRGFLGILLVALELLLPIGSDACGDPPIFESMKPKNNPAPPYDLGYKVEYDCRPGYGHLFPVRPTSVICQAGNTWKPPLQEACTKKLCLQLSQPLDGKVVYVNGTTEFGSEAHYDCNEGYYLLGTKIIHCEVSGDNVDWSHKAPQCQDISCQPPKQIPNGEFTPSHRDSFEYQEAIIFSCKPSNGPDEYSLVGESRLTCIGHNQWSSDPPECKVVQCEYPELMFGRMAISVGKRFQYKSEVAFECLEGFYLEGSSTIICGANSTWEPQIPKCIRGHSMQG